MGFLKREAKQFDYKPRFYKGEGNPYKFTYQLDKFRTTVGKNKNLKSKFSDSFSELKNIKTNGINKTILIIALILVFLFLVVIDFDLSIFLPKN